MEIASYRSPEFYDELFLADGSYRPAAIPLLERVASLPIEQLHHRQQMARLAMLRMGVTFNHYADRQGTEKVLPFDIIPRILAIDEWRWLEKGLQQRIAALNLFIADIYGDQKIIKDGIIPAELIFSAPGFLKPCMGLQPAKQIWCHITGTDLVRDKDGRWYVLEDNLRCPSGVSYVIENRRVNREGMGCSSDPTRRTPNAVILPIAFGLIRVTISPNRLFVYRGCRCSVRRA